MHPNMLGAGGLPRQQNQPSIEALPKHPRVKHLGSKPGIALVKSTNLVSAMIVAHNCKQGDQNFCAGGA
jgi:hypothetical protein